MAKIAIVPGSFDPITIGHVDIIKRSAELFDEVYALAVVNAEKRGFYSVAERLSIMESALKDISNVKCAVFDGLTSDYANSVNATIMVRGARNGSDFDDEYSYAYIMKSFKSDLETVILPSKPELAFISSTYVKELIRHSCSLSNVIDEKTAKLMIDYYNNGKNN